VNDTFVIFQNKIYINNSATLRLYIHKQYFLHGADPF